MNCTDIIRTIENISNIMSTTINDQARFDARLPKEQKLFFEKAAFLGGYRNLTDFIIMTAQEKAKEIIAEKEHIIASERDGRIFFDGIVNPQRPSKTLKSALKDYKTYFIV